MATTPESLPPIRRDLEIRPEYFRGRLCYVVADPVTQSYYHLREIEYLVLRCFQRGLDVAQTRDEVRRRMGADVSEIEIFRFVSQLQSANLLNSRGLDDARDLAAQARQKRRARIRAALSNYLFITIPLWDPDRALERLLPVFRLLISPPALVGFLAVALAGAYTIVANFRQLTADAFSILSGWNLVLLSAVIFGTKFVHELGHALTCKHLGGRVRAIGPAFLVFQPCMYTDTTDAWRFPSKWDRIRVTAAGVGAELVMAGAAALVWLTSEPGLLKQVCYTVMLTCTVSTVLFNANPLLRFDGYYILSDLLEMPNLRLRASEHLNALLDRWLIGRAAPPPRGDAEDRAVYLAYGAARFLYVWAVVVGIALLLMALFVPLGVLMLATSFYGMVTLPVWRRAAMVRRQIESGRAPLRALVVIAGAAAVLAGAWFLPTDYTVKAPCVLTPARYTIIRAPGAGQVVEVLVAPGERVAQGDRLLRLADPLLEEQAGRLRAQALAVEARRRGALASDPGEWKALESQMRKLEEELHLVEDRLAALDVRAPHGGTVVALRPEERASAHLAYALPDDPREMAGAWVPEGAGFFAVADLSRMFVQVFVREYDVAELGTGDPVSCRFVAAPFARAEARLARIVPVDVKVIENAGITLADIGYIPVKPGPEGGRPLVTLYLAEAWPQDESVGAADRAMSLWGLTGKARILTGHGPAGPRVLARLARNLRLRLQRL